MNHFYVIFSYYHDFSIAYIYLFLYFVCFCSATFNSFEYACKFCSILANTIKSSAKAHSAISTSNMLVYLTYIEFFPFPLKFLNNIVKHHIQYSFFPQARCNFIVLIEATHLVTQLRLSFTDKGKTKVVRHWFQWISTML